MIATKPLPNQEKIKQLLCYDPLTGVFIWKSTGKKAGTIKSNGYVRIGIEREYYSAHRLAWVYVYGKEPDEHIDHINRNRSDNRIKNLRQATVSQNLQNRPKPKNNTTGYVGVCYHKRSNKFDAYIKVNGKLKHLGYFKTAEDAAVVAEQARKQFYSHHIK